MNQDSFQIEMAAVKELADWRAFFADEVNVRAREIASASDSQGIISVDHFRQAAIAAVQSLTSKIEDSGTSNDRREAA